MPVNTPPAHANGRPWPTRLQALLLRAALGDRETAAAAWTSWRAAIDLDLIDEGSHRLLPLLYRNLVRHGLAVGDPILARIKGVYRYTWVANRRAFAALGGLARQLGEAGIPTLALKGAPLALLHYGDVGVRPMGDLDLLVPLEQAEAAMAVVRRHGWAAALDHPERLIPAFHATEFVNAEGVRVDLHWRPLMELFAADAAEPFWAGAVPLNLGGVTTNAPGPTELLLLTLVHGARWNPTPPFRWIADALVILRGSAPAIDWDRLVAGARAGRITLPAAAALDHLVRRWGAPVPPGVVARLRATPVPAMLRLEYAAKQRPLGFFPSAVFHTAHAGRAVGSTNLGRALLHLPTHLRHLWRLDGPLHLPAAALAVAHDRFRRYRVRQSS
jgi:hypothetical protein